MLKTNKISRLMAIKQEELNVMQQDLSRLDFLVNESKAVLYSMLEQKEKYERDIRDMEGNGAYYFAQNSIEHRRFYAYFLLQYKEAENKHKEVVTLQEKALEELKRVYIEMKSYEILVANKTKAQNQINSRKQYLMADDQQSVRFLRR